MAEEIQIKLIEEEMKEAYLDYAMSVITGRALPDVKDGLKPVHRRILYTMYQLGLFSNKPFRKAASVVGTTMAKFHPHGDAAIYDAMARLVQDFSLRYPLIHGQGNWGSIEGFPPAAQRYTECKMTRLGELMLEDIDKDTVIFAPNFDGSSQEPLILPSKFPNLLVNGSSGIAVGMATNIPPHNISEVVDGLIALVDNKEIDVVGLMNYVKAPDFPTGGTIVGMSGVEEAYKTGRGKIVLRAKSTIEEKGDKKFIIIEEIPYLVNKSVLLENIAKCISNKKIDGVNDLRDESDRKGMRVVIELKRGYDSNLVLNQLYQNTSLETTFGVIMIALVNGEPKILTLKDLMLNYILHRKDVVTKRTKFDLNKSEERKHLVDGLIIALDDIDNVVRLIKESKDVEVANKLLIEKYSLSNSQSKAILDMKLQRLTSLETEKLKEENIELISRIKDLKEILGSEEKVFTIVRNELKEIKTSFSDERRTLVEENGKIIEEKELVKEEATVITLTHKGYIKRIKLDAYKEQRRGGKGVIGAVRKEEDFIEHLKIVSTHDNILFFGDKGRVYWKKAYEIMEGSRYSIGSNIVNFLNLKDERITAIIPIREFKEGYFLFMGTKKGLVKKVELNEFAKERRNGKIAINLKNDELIDVLLTDGNKEIIIGTSNGIASRFRERDVRVTGRNASGVRGIRLEENDEVVGLTIANENETLLTITEDGFGKRTEINEYRLTGRGGKGVADIKADKVGKVVGIMDVKEEYGIMIITSKGNVIRIKAKDISLIGRATQGVRLIKLIEDDKVVGIARVFGQ